MVTASATFTARDLNDGNFGDNIRESLSDIIYNISPTETPAVYNFGKSEATAPLHEWLKDDLQTAGTNAHIEGEDFGTNVTNDVTQGGRRLQNYLQISKKQIKIGRRANIATKAGRTSEISYQLAKKGLELRRDIEFNVLDNQAGVAETSSVAARSAGLPAWLRTNTDFTTGGADPTLSGTGGEHGFPNAARTDGTTAGPLSEADLLQLIRQCYDEGGDPNVIMMRPSIKQRWSGYLFSQTTTRSATQYQDQQAEPRAGATVLGGVDVYVSDFGVLDVVPNRFQRELDVYVLDTNLFDIAYFDGFRRERLAKVGDSERYHILADWCLVSREEAGSAIFTDTSDAAVTAAARA